MKLLNIACGDRYDKKWINIDFLTIEKQEYQDELFDYHKETLKDHKKTLKELIYNPKYYFIYRGVKFVSFNQLYKMKRNRADGSDINDYHMMKSSLSNHILSVYIFKIKQSIFYFKIKLIYFFRDALIKFLHKMRIYNTVKHIYKKFKLE